MFGLQLLSCVSFCLRGEVGVFHCWIYYVITALTIRVLWVLHLFLDFPHFGGFRFGYTGKENVTTPLDGVGPLEGPCLKPLLSNRLTYFLHCLSTWVSSHFLSTYWFSRLFVVNFVRLVCIIDWPKENSMAACDVVWLVFPSVSPHFWVWAASFYHRGLERRNLSQFHRIAVLVVLFCVHWQFVFLWCVANGVRYWNAKPKRRQQQHRFHRPFLSITFNWTRPYSVTWGHVLSEPQKGLSWRKFLAALISK